MDQSRPAFSNLQTLATRWRVLGMMAVALARQVLCLRRLGAQAGLRQAELLEAWLYASLTDLSALIAAQPNGLSRSTDDDAALKHLKTIYIMLMVLTLMVGQLKRELAAAADRLCAALHPALGAALPLPRADRTGYIDTS